MTISLVQSTTDKYQNSFFFRV